MTLTFSSDSRSSARQIHRCDRLRGAQRVWAVAEPPVAHTTMMAITTTRARRWVVFIRCQVTASGTEQGKCDAASAEVLNQEAEVLDQEASCQSEKAGGWLRCRVAGITCRLSDTAL